MKFVQVCKEMFWRINFKNDTNLDIQNKLSDYIKGEQLEVNFKKFIKQELSGVENIVGDFKGKVEEYFPDDTSYIMFCTIHGTAEDYEIQNLHYYMLIIFHNS